MINRGLQPSRWRPADTSEEAWALVVDHWRAMSPTDKAEMANTISIDCERLARAGIAFTEPSATEARVRYLLAERRYGSDLAQAAFGNSR